jgi:hypothetical protein
VAAKEPKELIFRAIPGPQAPRPQAIYLSSKMQVYIFRILGISRRNLEGIIAAKARYDIDKKEKGLASIKLIQMEVENALILATDGRYKRTKI